MQRETATAKRLVAGIVGVVAALAGLLPLRWAIGFVNELENGATPFHVTAILELTMCSLAFGALLIGARFLGFAYSGESRRSSSWVRPVLLGIGSMFPSLLFSLPLTVLWARRRWPGDGQSVLAAMEVSLYVCFAAGVVCCVVLLWKRRAQSKSLPA